MLKKYKIIYADPPWKYDRKIGEGVVEKQYPTMEIEEICSLPIKEIADKDCILFLWATFPKLKEALKVIEAWGFRYRTVAFVWIKLNKKKKTPYFGLGNWTRSNSEICLLAKRETPKRKSNKVFQLIFSPLEYHSKKPDIVREKIIELVGDAEKIELFARTKTKGWDIWGNEVKNDIILKQEYRKETCLDEEKQLSKM